VAAHSLIAGFAGQPSPGSACVARSTTPNKGAGTAAGALCQTCLEDRATFALPKYERFQAYQRTVGDDAIVLRAGDTLNLDRTVTITVVASIESIVRRGHVYAQGGDQAWH
jgi:hypothetical protein